MAITKLNSLAIPDDTIVEADLSYPLTSFSSTGIDDNATSTKLTVSDAGIDVTGTADVDGTVNSRGLQAKGSPSLSFNASNWMTQQETGVARTYICGPDASTYQPWEIYRATSTGGASLTMKLDASGNVGIGTTPNAGLKLDVVSASGSTLAGFRRNSQSDGEVGLILYGGTGGVSWTIYQPTSSNDIRFYGNGADKLTIDSSGNAYFYANGGELRFTGHSFYRPNEYGSGIHLSTNRVLPANENGSVSDNTEDLGASTYRWKDLYLSGGAYLGGTAAANHLDDYEEGTWTVNLNSSGGDATISVVNTTAYYVKIGRKVTLFWYSGAITCSASGSGYARIQGLPFTAANLYQNYAVGSHAHTTVASSTDGYAVPNGTTYVLMLPSSTYGAPLIASASHLYMMLTVTYYTA